MRNLKLLLLICTIGLFACQKKEVTPPDKGPDPNPDSMMVVVDSVPVDFLDLNLNELPERFIPNQLLVDDNNVLWVANLDSYDGEQNGNAILMGYDIDNDEWKVEFLPSEWPYNSIFQIALGKDGELFLMLGPSLQREVAAYKNGEWRLIEFDDIVWDISANPIDGALWVSGGKGLYRQLDDERTMFNNENSILPLNEDINGSRFKYVKVDGAGTVWGAGSNRLFFFDGTDWQEHPNSPFSESYIVTVLTKASNNSMFITSASDNFYEINTEGILKDYLNVVFEEDDDPGYLEITLNPLTENLTIADGLRILHYNANLDAINIASRENTAFPEDNFPYRIVRDQNNAVWVGGFNFLGKLPEEFE